MESLSVIAPLIGVVLGSVITGIGAYVRARAERKRVIGRALSDLLEIRHQAVGIELVLREVRSRIAVPEEVIQSFRTHMNAVVPVDVEVHRRYDEAISLLSGVDPLLAFNLRSKNKVSHFMDTLRGVSASIGAAPTQIESVEAMLRLAIMPALDDAVLELANRHSLNTARRVKKLIATTALQPELSALLDNVANVTLKEPSKGAGTQAAS